MLVYGSPERVVQVADEFDALREGIARQPGVQLTEAHTRLCDLLITAGELEQGLADALCAERDAFFPALRILRALSDTLGMAMARSWLAGSDGGRDSEHPDRCTGNLLDQAQIILEELSRQQDSWPVSITVNVPEGYAFYSLYPEQYMHAAQRFMHEHSAEQACVVIGLRSIGTSLASSVAGILRCSGYRAETLTLRPRGHPFDRYIEVDEELGHWVSVRTGYVKWLIVDEGPGLSCSSFGSAARFLYALGVEPAEICFLPAWWGAPGEYTTEENRIVWEQTQKYVSSFEEAVLDRGSEMLFALDGAGQIAYDTIQMSDIGAGQWRHLFWPDEADWPAVNPQMERRKYLLETANGKRYWAKFGGLGRYGRQSAAMAAELADAGFSPDVRGNGYGFTIYDYLDGACPLGSNHIDIAPEFLDIAAQYCAYRYKTGKLGRKVAVETLLEMLHYNTAEALGEERARLCERYLGQRPLLESAPAIWVDGRHHPHDWLRSADGRYRKTDSADHASDHFLVGATDIAWDLAALQLEFALNERSLIERYSSLTGNRDVAQRLPFYRAAYLAFQTGLAAISLSANAYGAEASRLEQTLERYRTLLQLELATAIPGADTGS